MAEAGLDDAVFGAIADPTRRRVLLLLGQRPRSVEALAAHFAISRPAISKHLKLLGRAGLVSHHRDGRLNIYRAEPGPLEAVLNWLDAFWRGRLSILKRIAEGDS